MTDGPEVRVGDGSGNNESRTCAQCGTDCPPETFEADDGFRVAFMCPAHGVHSVVDPFEGRKYFFLQGRKKPAR